MIIMYSECEIVGESGHDLLQGTIPVFAW